MSISSAIGKAAEFDKAEEYLDAIVPDTKNMDLYYRIEEALLRVKQGKLTEFNLLQLGL